MVSFIYTQQIVQGCMLTLVCVYRVYAFPPHQVEVNPLSRS